MADVSKAPETTRKRRRQPQTDENSLPGGHASTAANANVEETAPPPKRKRKEQASAQVRSANDQPLPTPAPRPRPRPRPAQPIPPRPRPPLPESESEQSEAARDIATQLAADANAAVPAHDKGKGRSQASQRASGAEQRSTAVASSSGQGGVRFVTPVAGTRSTSRAGSPNLRVRPNPGRQLCTLNTLYLIHLLSC